MYAHTLSNITMLLSVTLLIEKTMNFFNGKDNVYSVFFTLFLYLWMIFEIYINIHL